LDRLTPIVYDELRRLARRYMKGERPGHSLQTTALVNEAYTRLVQYKRMQWQNRAHFFAVSAQLMRRILVDHARRHNLRRGGGMQQVSPDEAANAIELLQVAVPYELAVPGIAFFANFGGLYPVYVRGEAFLAEQQGGAAAAEFQKILTAASFSPIPSAHWPTCSSAEHTLCREIRSRLGVLTRISSPSGRTLIPTSRSSSKPRRNTPG
jgi:hypothetical protein